MKLQQKYYLSEAGVYLEPKALARRAPNVFIEVGEAGDAAGT